MSQLIYDHQVDPLLRFDSEEAIFKNSSGPIDELRWKVKQALKKSKPPKPNISKEERLAIKSLQSDENIIVPPADKCNATVVMDKVEYSNKLVDLIGDNYCKIN